MREIKFRAWDKVEKKWMPEEWVSSQPIWQLNADSSRYIWVQYTGLKDKNGKEIYEGYILGGGVAGRLRAVYPVIFMQGEFRLEMKHLRYLSVYPHCEELEVIGNIYENPELISK